MTDQPETVRDEDAFDVAAVHAWAAGKVDGIDADGPLPQVQQFGGGASNLTYLLGYPHRDVVLRRPPTGTKAKGAHDMRREFVVQQRLRPAFGLVPQMLALCQDDSLIGADFYLMERLRGTVLRRDPPAGLTIDPAQAQALSVRAVQTLVALHAVDTDETGLSDLGRGAGYVQRQVDGWSRRMRDASTDGTPDVEPVMEWLAAHRPDDVATCLVHNDYRLDNLVLDIDLESDSADLAIVGVLDWEMATLGDPLMDLGGALAYWVQADDDEQMQQLRRQPTHLPGMLTRDEVVELYAEQTSIRAEDWTFYEVFGLFRLAGIAQQIWYRVQQGQTSNPAYDEFGPMVQVLSERCARLIGGSGSGGAG